MSYYIKSLYNFLDSLSANNNREWFEQHRSEYETLRALWLFPVVRDLMVNRNAFDQIQQAGGYVSFNCGGAQDANNLPISKDVADTAMDSATCIGCGACVPENA